MKLQYLDLDHSLFDEDLPKEIEIKYMERFKGRSNKSKRRTTNVDKFQRRSIGVDILVYFEFLAYHLLFYISGPLIYIIIYPLKYSQSLCSNLMFIMKDRSSIIQGTNFLLVYAYILSCVLNESEFSSWDIYLTLTMVMILRASLIAGKYATFTRQQLFKVRYGKLEKEEIRKELLLCDWLVQSDKTILESLQEGINMSSIETSNFLFSFIVAPRKSTIRHLEIDNNIRLNILNNCQSCNFKELEEKNKTLAQYSLNSYEIGLKDVNTIKITNNNEVSEIYHQSGITVLLNLIRNLNKDRNTRTKSLMCALLATLRILVQAGTWWNRVKIDNILNVVIILPIALNSIIFYRILYLYFFQGYSDISRKSSLMQQLGHMISISRQDSSLKFLPSISIVDKLNIHSWMKARILVREYGQKFFKRHEITMTTLGIWNIFSLILLIFLYLNVIKIQYLARRSLIITLLFDFIIFSILILGIFFNAAMLNSYYESHIYKLVKLKELTSEIYNFRDAYFPFLSPENSFSLTGIQARVIFPRASAPSNPLISALISSISCLPGSSIGDHLRSSMEAYEVAIEVLKEERKNNQISVLGIKIDMTLFFNSCAASLGVVAAGSRILIDGGEGI